MNLPLQWHFLDDEIGDLPSNFTLPKFESAAALPLPQTGDLVSFDDLPKIKFIVSYREFAFSCDGSQPLSLHLHISRLSLPKK